MAEGGGEEGPIELEYTPTWIVAAVCSVIVLISLVVERLIHHLGKILQRKNQKPLFEALQKVKEELMLLGFISLLLTVSQGLIQRICIPQRWTNHMLPCKKGGSEAAAKAHFRSTALFSGVLGGGGRRLLAEGGSRSLQCTKVDSLHFSFLQP